MVDAFNSIDDLLLNGQEVRINDSFIDWLNENKNPLLWHRLVFGLNYDREISIAAVKWIVAQPACLPITALAIAYKLDFKYYCNKADTEIQDWSRTNLGILKLIEDNANQGFYKDFEYGSPSITNAENRERALNECRDATEKLSRKGLRSAFIGPIALLVREYGSKKIVYECQVEEDALYLPKR